MPLSRATLLLLLVSCTPHANLRARDPGVRAPAPVALAFERPRPVEPGNVLILLTDDQGIDQVRAYGEHPDPPPTPNIDGLAAEGVLFRNAWASPTCSPSRGALLSGRMPRRTGMGSVIQFDEDYEMPLTEVLIPRMLEGAKVPWSNAAFGKWHLASIVSDTRWDHPNAMGFTHWSGSLANLSSASKERWNPQTYTHWEKITNGKRRLEERYATTVTVDEALEAIGTLPEPWLVYVAFNAPHEPMHVPPADLHHQDVGPKSSTQDKYRAMVEALDTEIGRLLKGIRPAMRNRTTVMFLSDNGTPEHAIREPWDETRGKNTPFEGGVNIPLIVTGPYVAAPGESAALVHVVDVFATVADIAGVDLDKGPTRGVPIDGRSLLPYLADPTQGGRDVVFSEKFAPNGTGAKKRTDWKITRSASLKLIESNEHGTLLFDVRDGLDEGPPLDLEEIPRGLAAEWTALQRAHAAHWAETP